ncbi:ABC transporter substrate-binding protein [Defluviitoga tunisiensis]|uniref:Periplasmic-binding component of ABC transport systems specific for trehalose/maltose and similar oligosaccharides n=1 Tax=Defluviitoga tunisiensis TaxID=1006576 RepID=A0A0C7NPB9_DEFTU|nr:sugar ABC transporter substrate-binding protein [Defluviitoga tunisiensis]CEP77742.1 periplasmic-binding component of ABC transport systems specific for trehalose/maltose and similar oligosaccharides [Defluviitoga tunisiensis]
MFFGKKRNFRRVTKAFSLIVLFIFCSYILLGETVTLEIWGYFTQGVHGIYDTVERWNNTHGDVKVKYTYIPYENLNPQITRAVLSGNVPDIVYVEIASHASFASMGAFEDITSKVKSEEVVEKTNQIFEGPLASVTFNNKIYGLPDNSNTLVLFYNKDMFKRAGLDPNNPPATWEELEIAASKISALGKEIYGMIFTAFKSEEGTFQILPFIQMAGADYDSLDTPEAAEAIKFLTNFIKNGWAPSDVLNITQTESFDFFTAQRVGMALNGPWMFDALNDVNFDWGITLLPVNNKKNIRASALGGENVAIMAGSDHKEESWEFLKWLYYDDNNYVQHLKDGNRLPSRGGLMEFNPEWQNFPMNVVLEQLEFAKARGPHPQWPQISNYIQIAFQKAFSGQASPEQALKEAANNIKKLL